MNFVIAFQAEAKPIIEALQLSKTDDRLFPCYQNERHRLVISGLGKVRARKAVEHLLSQGLEKNSCWLNVGIAGHGSLEVGNAFLAAKIQDEVDGGCFFPPLVHPTILPPSTLISCEQPSTAYLPDCGYDMEGHAFYGALLSETLREFVQVVKIVSDNPKSPINEITPAKATSMIETHVTSVLELTGEMEKCRAEILPSEEVGQIHQSLLRYHHFSVTRSHQLYDLTRHVFAHQIDPRELSDKVRFAKDGRDAITTVENWLKGKRQLR